MAIMGVDVGTTGTKAVAFSLEGNVLGQHYKEYPIASPRPGWMELNPGQVRAAIEETVAAAADQARKAGQPVKTIGISSQGEAFVPLDDAGNPLYNIQITLDNRCRDQLDKIRETLDERALFELTGHSLSSIYSLPKFLWMAQNEPDLWRRAAKILCMEDYACWILGVDPAISHNLAARTQVFDMQRLCWSEPMCELAQVRPEQLSRPLPSGSVSGQVPASVAGRLNLDSGVAVCTGGHDQSCGAMGGGATSPGLAMYATGTVECITLVWDGFPADTTGWEKNHLNCYPFVQPGRYCSLMFNLTGGNLLKWYRDTFGADQVARARQEGLDPYEVICRDLPDGPTDVLVLPHFTTTGTPWLDDETVGAMTGLRLSTTREEVVKALMEGVTYEMKLNLEMAGSTAESIAELYAIGGGAKSPRWVQIKADILDRPITTLQVDEVVALGAALLSGLGAGLIDDAGAATARFVTKGQCLAPAPTRPARTPNALPSIANSIQP